MKKIVIVGVHGTGKSRICEKILTKIWCSKDWYSCSTLDEYKYFGGTYDINSELDLIRDIANFTFIHEQFREVVRDIPNFTKQTEEITLATYAKQLYLENLYTVQGKNILCDRSVLDTFVYYDYFNKAFLLIEDDIYKNSDEGYIQGLEIVDYASLAKHYTKESYSKIYLIEPSDREIEDDGFRLADKKQQLEIHQLFLEYFKGFNNVEIIHQENAHKEEFIEKVVNEFNS